MKVGIDLCIEIVQKLEVFHQALEPCTFPSLKPRAQPSCSKMITPIQRGNGDSTNRTGLSCKTEGKHKSSFEIWRFCSTVEKGDGVTLIYVMHLATLNRDHEFRMIASLRCQMNAPPLTNFFQPPDLIRTPRLLILRKLTSLKTPHFISFLC